MTTIRPPFRSAFLRHLLAALLAGAVAACAPRQLEVPPAAAATAAAAPVWPEQEWERIEVPESVGYSSAALAAAAQHAEELGTTGMMVIVGGRVLLEHGDVRELSYLASVRKSILSMLYGIRVADGTIRLDRTLRDIGITERVPLTDVELSATVHDVLSARSGIFLPASNPGDDLASAPPRGSHPPGTYFLYSNWDFNVLGTIFERETGQEIYDALERDLARPIGMQDFDRSIHRRTGDTTASIHLAYHMVLSTRDMARIGYLMLREGSWRGEQVVPREWVRRSTRALTPLEEMNPPRHRENRFGYGYLWWVYDGEHTDPLYEGAYAGIGAGGQYIVVIPRLDMAIAHKTNVRRTRRAVRHERFFDLVDTIVAARCESSCPSRAN